MMGLPPKNLTRIDTSAMWTLFRAISARTLRTASRAPFHSIYFRTRCAVSLMVDDTSVVDTVSGFRGAAYGHLRSTVLLHLYCTCYAYERGFPTIEQCSLAQHVQMGNQVQGLLCMVTHLVLDMLAIIAEVCKRTTLESAVDTSYI